MDRVTLAAPDARCATWCAVIAPGTPLPTLYLIRHGETVWSRSGQHTGRSDIPLTAHGEAMARKLAPSLARVAFAHVLTSPSQRARDTGTLAISKPGAVIDPDLGEWDYGRYDGLTTAQIHRHEPGWNVFADGAPDGESVADVRARADRLLTRLRAMAGPIALFTHGQFGCALAARWIGLAPGAGEHFALDPASISVLGPKPGHGTVPVIARWNLIPDGCSG